MQQSDQIKSLTNLFRICRAYIPEERRHFKSISQTAVVSIFRFNTEFIQTHQSLKSKLKCVINPENKNILGQREVVRFETFIQILSQHMESLLNSTNPVFELFYNRRTIMPGSRHSGQVCFPGGKLDKGETDVQAGMREVREETGLDLALPDSIYIGKMPVNQFLYRRKGKKHYLSNLIFFNFDGVFNETLPAELRNNTDPESMSVPNDEVDKTWWVPWNIFFEDNANLFVKSRKMNPQWFYQNNIDLILKIVQDQETYRYLIGEHPDFENFSKIDIEISPKIKNYVEKNIALRQDWDKITNVLKFFSKENMKLKNLSLRINFFHFPNNEVLWGITLTLTSLLVMLGLDSNIDQKAIAWGEFFSRKGLEREFNCKNDGRVNQFFRQRQQEIKEQYYDVEKYKVRFKERQDLKIGKI